MERTILDEEGAVKNHFSFVTDLPITAENIKDRIACGITNGE